MKSYILSIEELEKEFETEDIPIHSYHHYVYLFLSLLMKRLLAKFQYSLSLQEAKKCLLENCEADYFKSQFIAFIMKEISEGRIDMFFAKQIRFSLEDPFTNIGMPIFSYSFSNQILENVVLHIKTHIKEYIKPEDNKPLDDDPDTVEDPPNSSPNLNGRLKELKWKK